MKSPREWIAAVSEKLDLPAYVSAGLSYTAVEGFHQVTIEKQTALLSYSETKIIVSVPMGEICVAGCGLHIRLMKQGRMIIAGQIEGIRFCREAAHE